MWQRFKIDSLPVTNGEFLEFVSAGGYAEPRYWLLNDWHWKELEQKQHPTCWLKQGDSWFYRAMFDLLPSRASGELAGVCEPRRSPRLCEVARQTFADRSRVPPRGLLRRQRTRVEISLGRCRSELAPWQL